MLIRSTIPQWLTSFSVVSNTTGHLEKWISGLGGLAGMLAIIIICIHLVDSNGAALVVASLGASAVLLFAVPHGPLSQPWPVIGGHTVSAIIGVACAQWIPDTVLAGSAAVGLSIVAMHYLLCIHPPGGATALTAVVGGESFHSLGFEYVFTPVLISAITIIIVAIIFNYPFVQRRYPASWTMSEKGKKLPLKTNIEDDRLTRDDLEAALKSMNTIIDISGHDLEQIYRTAKQHSQTASIETAKIKVGQCYSNGHYGSFWQVREIIDMPQEVKSSSDKVIYRIVAGKNLYKTDSASVDDFSLWARYEVFLSEGAWLRIEKNDSVHEQSTMKESI